MEGLKSTWVAANEVAKELGQIKDYAIYSNQFGAADQFDLILVVEMESTDDIAPNRERYEQFLEAYGQANIDKANETLCGNRDVSCPEADCPKPTESYTPRCQGGYCTVERKPIGS